MKANSVVVDGTKVSGTLANFPVTVPLSDTAAVRATARPDYGDVRFSLNGAVLNHVIESAGGRTVATDAVWCWFNNPRLLCDRRSSTDYVYASHVGKFGDIKITQYNVGTQASSTFTLSAALEVDDHDPPGLLIKTDGKLLCCYSKHSADNLIRFRTQTTAGDNSAYVAETTLDVGGPVAYPHPVMLSGESNKIYLFYRKFFTGISHKRCFRTSTDGGSSWSAETVLFQNAPDRPYCNIFDNGVDRIDFIVTEGNPNEVVTNLWHCYIEGGNVKDSSGTTISSLAALGSTGLTVGSAALTKIYDNSVNGRAWGWDLCRDPTTGNPVCVFAAFPGSNGTSAPDHRYYYARWTGSAWSYNQMTAAGGAIISSGVEVHYSGGLALKKDNPNVVFLSRQQTIETTAWDVERWQTGDGGATWSSYKVTQTSGYGEKNVRPTCAMFPTRLVAPAPEVFWTTGRYDTFTSYDQVLMRRDATAKAVARVRLPYLTSSGLRFNMFYGDGSVQPQANPYDASAIKRWALFERNFDGTYFQTRQEGIALGGLSGMTVRFRVRCDEAAPAVVDYVVSNWSGTPTDAQVLTRVRTTGHFDGFVAVEPNTQVGGAFTLLQGGVLRDGQMHAVSVSYDTSGGLQLWVDGQKSATTFSGAGATMDGQNSANQLNFGRSAHDATVGTILDGNLETIQFDNVKRSDAWIATQGHDELDLLTVTDFVVRRVRDTPPLRFSVLVTNPSGSSYRWAYDEPRPANVPTGLNHSDTMPGGFEQMGGTLPRKPDIEYADLARFSTIQLKSVGGYIFGEYRLDSAPRVSGDQFSVAPNAVGWQATLDDDKSVVMIPVDRQMGGWSEPGPVRESAISASGFPEGKIPVTVDDQGITWKPPAEALALNEDTEVMYVCPAGVTIGQFAYRGKQNGTWTNFDAASLDTSASEDMGSASGNALTLDDTARIVTPVASALRYGRLRVKVSTAHTPAAGVQRIFSKIAVFGDHGQTAYDLPAAGDLRGVLAHEIVRIAVTRWAPLLTIGPDSITPSTYVIAHLAFPDPTTAGEIVRQASRFDLPDWAVWADRTFYWNQQGARARYWRTRVAPSGLEETGAQVERTWESIMVQYQDVDGRIRRVGPPGSGADTVDSSLKDYDPANPANQLGIVRRDLLQMGVATSEEAIKLGSFFLAQAKLLDRSGRAKAVGYIEDSAGVRHPYWMPRAGDYVSFLDAADPSYRRITKTQKDHDSRTVTFDLDAPPEGLQALLERLGVDLVPLGVGT